MLSFSRQVLRVSRRPLGLSLRKCLATEAAESGPAMALTFGSPTEVSFLPCDQVEPGFFTFLRHYLQSNVFLYSCLIIRNCPKRHFRFNGSCQVYRDLRSIIRFLICFDSIENCTFSLCNVDDTVLFAT